MARKQTPTPAGLTGNRVQGPHQVRQPDPSCIQPEHDLVSLPATSAEAGRGTLPEWVRRRAADPEELTSIIDADGPKGADEFLTVAEVAVIWRVSARTLRRRIAAGEIPHIRVGRQVRIPRQATLVGQHKVLTLKQYVTSD